MDSSSKKSKDKSAIASQKLSLICKDFTLHGDIETTHSIRVEGTIVGNILDAENVVIGTTGSVKGNITTKDLTVFGNIEGDVSATHSVSIRDSGKINGKLSTANFTIDKGATYEGKVITHHTSH